MNTLLKRVATLAAMLLLAVTACAQDANFYIFLCLGQSNMEGFPGIPETDKTSVDPRFQVLAAVDFPALKREKGHWYAAVPPLCRPNSGLCPADYFGRTLAAELPANIKVGVVNVAIGGCKIELFDKTSRQAYAATAPSWMAGMLAAYDGDPYQRLVEMGKLAQQAGVIRGILLHQGESNMGDPEWSAKVKAVYEDLLQELGLTASEVPLLVGEVVASDQQGKCADMNKTIGELPKLIPTAHVVSAAGCACLQDHLHFSPEGYRELGRRYAGTMLPLLGFKPVRAR